MGHEDEENEHEQHAHAHFVPASAMPEGLRRMLGMTTPEEQAAAARQEMSSEDLMIRIQAMFAEADEDTLKAYRAMVGFGLMDQSAANKMVGVINAYLQINHGYCLGCGEKHDPSSLLQ